MPLSISDELSLCDQLCNAQNRAYALQAQAQASGDDASAAKFGVDARQLDVQIELLQDKINVEWVATAGDAINSLALAQKSIQGNIAVINQIIAGGKTVGEAFSALDQIIALASKLAPV
jgi:pyruvate/2-oxoglutarate dehydrogenase complex dihydrolipoamide dehydrogenase (E3) component